MTNKDRALIIVNTLFEMTDHDFDITFSGHCGGMVIGFSNGNEDGWHFHISEHKDFPEQLKEIVQAIYEAKSLQEKVKDE